MNERYEKPEMNVLKIMVEDVITGSNFTGLQNGFNGEGDSESLDKIFQ